MSRKARRLVGTLRLVGPLQATRFVAAKLRGVETIEVRLPGVRTSLVCRTRGSDRWVLWQVFSRDHFEYALRGSPRLIVDGGANVGYVTVYLAERYPAAKVVAVEPNAGNLALLKRNVAAYPNVEIIEGALWPESADLSIENPEHLSWGFRVGVAPSPSAGSFKGVTIGHILTGSGEESIDLLKLDIEGSEEQLFSRDYEAWIGRVRKLMIETHGSRHREAVLRATEGVGFVGSRHGEHLVLERAEA